MSTNYLDNRSLLDLRTKAAFVKAVNNVNSTRALGESDNDELKDDVEDVIFNFKEWLIENKKLLESVDSKFKTTIEKYPIKEGIKSYLYQFAEEATKKQLSTSIDSTIHIIEELDTINLDSVDFDVFEKTITDLSMLLYSNQEYGSENILSVLEDSYKNVTDEAEIIKDPEGVTEDSTESLNDMFITTKIETEDTAVYLNESIGFINSKMMTLIRIHFKLINILSDNFIKRVQSSRNMLKFKLLCMIIQNNIELDTTCLFKMINMDVDNLKLVNKPAGESAGISKSLPILEQLGIVYSSTTITEPVSLKAITASENSRLFKNVLVQELYMDKITNIYNYTPKGELGPVGGAKNAKNAINAINAAKDKLNFSTRGLQELITKVIEMIKNLFKGIAVEEKKLQKYANDIKKALNGRIATGDKKKKVRIYTTGDLENAGLSNDSNSSAMIFANRIEKDKRDNMSNKVDFSSEDNVKRTLSILVKNFEKMDPSDFGAAIRKLFNYVDVDVNDDATAQRAKSAIKGQMTTEDNNVKNTWKKMPWAKKSLTYTNASGNKAYTQLAEALNTLYILCDGFTKLKGIDYLNKEQKNMNKLSNQLKRYLAKTASVAAQQAKKEVKAESYDAISDAIRAYAEGIGDSMASSKGVNPKVSTDVKGTGNDIPDGDIEKEVVDPKDSDIKENKNEVTKVADLGEYGDFVKAFIINYSKTVNYNMMFYKQFLNNLIKATVDNLTAFYAVTKNG